MAAVQASRFSLLKIEDDADSDDNSSKSKGAADKKGDQHANNVKKKNKKKKKQGKSDTENLRSLAFNPGVGRVAQITHSVEKRPKEVSDQQWEQWKKKDSQFTTDAFEQDLQQAMLLSKIELEVPNDDHGIQGAGDASGANKDKKKKQKDKPAPMSLEAFHAADSPKAELNGDADSDTSRLKPKEADPRFFKKIDQDVQKAIQKEKIQEAYKQQYVVENARTRQFEETIEKKDESISSLEEENTKLQAELKQVKKRNQQFCHILSQGEMKEKTSVLLELEELKQIRDELTAEVTNLTSDLEKERSMVHTLRAELDKRPKGAKHGK